MTADTSSSKPAPEGLPFKSLHRSLSRRVLLLSLIGVVGLVSTIALGWLITLHQVQSRMDGIGLEAVGDFDRFFLDIQSDLKISSEGLAARKDQNAALLALRTRNQNFLDVMIVGSNGVVLMQRNAFGRPLQTKIENQAWVKSPPPFGQVVTGPVRFEGETPYVDMAVMATDDISLPAGLLVVRVDLTGLLNTTLDIKVGDTGYAYIADSAGQLVAFRNGRLLETGSNLKKLLGHSPQELVAKRLNCYTGLNGKWDLASAQPLKSTPWFAVVEQPVREALAPFVIPALILIISLVSVGLLLLNTIRFLHLRIVAPLLRLRDVVGQMADGQFKPSVEVRNNDELGQLAHSFNRMAEHLRQAFLDLESQIVALRQAESALRANDAKQSAMIGNIADVIAIVAPNGINQFKSPNVERWFGWKPQELVGASAWANVHPEDIAIVQAGLAVIMNQPHATHAGECRYRCKDGSYKWIELTAINLLSDPNIGGMLLNYHDITERKRAEAVRRESESQFQKLLELAPLALVYVNKDGVISFRNQRFIELLGYTADDVPTLTEWWPRAYPDPIYRQSVIQLWNATLQQALTESRQIDPIELKVAGKGGKVLDIEFSGIKVGEDFLMTLVDLAAHRLAQETHARLATVIEQATEIIVITNTEGTIIYVNPSFEKITGYTRAQAVGKNPRILKSGKQDTGFYVHMWAALKRGEVWHGHFINRRRDGSLYEEEATISPVRDAAGKVINYVGIKRDVTREMQLETELRQAQKMEAIGQLAGGVAHDFNNILSALMMQTELIGSIASLPNEAREGLEQISADTRRAADLTRQLLLFSRRQVMQLSILDLNEVVMNLAKMLQRLIRENVKLELNLHATPLMTRADASMLDQVLMNLAVNARDAMTAAAGSASKPPKQPWMRTAARANPEAAPGRYVCLSVSDTGSGIPPEILPRIFEPFFTTKEAGKGTGLGLATVFGIVKQHRGWIKVDNRPGQGVAFHIYLAACAMTVAEPISIGIKPKPRGGAETILMVEDEVAVLKPTRKVLERHGYKVLEAANGAEALKCWESNRGTISLLLTDLVMPGDMSGQELARQLRNQQPQLKIIYFSGYSPDIAGKDFELRSGEAFIQKPFTTEHLLVTIRQHLDG